MAPVHGLGEDSRRIGHNKPGWSKTTASYLILSTGHLLRGGYANQKAPSEKSF